MSRRLLTALEYPEADKVDYEEKQKLRQIVLWLEKTHLKSASQHVLAGLENHTSDDWNKYFDQYKDSIGCPVLPSHTAELQWLLGKAVQIDHAKNKAVYVKHAVDNIKSSNVPNVVAENPLDKLDFRSKEFTDRINQLAKTLNITPYPESLVTLKAVRKLINTRLSPECVENPSSIIVEGVPFPIQDTDLGFDLKDPVLNQAAKILRLLYIHDLRDLQTKANELVVAVQNVTGNPKTDTKLGQVGK